MAIATERWSDRRYQKNKSAAKAFDVIEASNEDEAVNADGIPQKGNSHPLDSNLKAEEPEASREGFNYYVVRVTYTRTAGDDGESTPNPLTERPKIQWDFGNSSEPIDRDIDGNAITNSAGDAFDPPNTADFGTYTVTISRNLLTFDPIEAVYYQNSCNKGTQSLLGICSIDEGQGRILYIKPTHEYTTVAQYVNVATVIEVRKDGHQIRALDQGQRGNYNDGNSGIAIGEIYDADGVQVSSPILLDGYGAPLNTTYKVAKTNTGATGPIPTGATLEKLNLAVFLKYKRYGLLPWGPLNLSHG